MEAYERLGVKPEDVIALPQITPILTQLPGKAKDKGVNKAIQFLRGSAEPHARKWLGVYDSIPSTVAALLPFEAFCLAADLTPKRVLEVITGACFEQSSNTSALLAAANHPDIVVATVKAAKNSQYGGGDRKMLHQHSGFIPVPKNQTTIISGGGVQNNTQNNGTNVNIGVGAVPQIEDVMARITNRFNVERLGLAAGDAEQARLLESNPESLPETEQAEQAELSEVIEQEQETNENSGEEATWDV